MLVMFLYDVISACRDVTDVRCQHVHVDTSHSPADFGEILRWKKLIVQSLEVFCEVVRFARGDRDFLK
jgi:hypothetical protein